jgi:hypothetical protein
VTVGVVVVVVVAVVFDVFEVCVFVVVVVPAVTGCAAGARNPILTTVPPPAASATVSTQVRWPDVPQ